MDGRTADKRRTDARVTTVALLCSSTQRYTYSFHQNFMTTTETMGVGAGVGGGVGWGLGLYTVPFLSNWRI